MQQISGQTDEYLPTKKIRQFRTHTNFPFSPDSDEQKIYWQSCGTNLGLKSHPKLNSHSYERLVQISDQNTQRVRCSKSQTEIAQNWFSESKTSPYLLFVIRLWTCLLTLVQTTYESTYLNFFSQYGHRIKFA